MPRVAGFLLIFMAAGCARTSTTMRNDGYDQAYLTARRREEGCRIDNRDRCCADIERKLKEALEAGAMQEGAAQLELLALSCRKPEADLIARFREPAPENAPAEHAPGVTLSYDVRLPAYDRLYWVGAFVDGKSFPAPVAPGPHSLTVELHLLPLAGVGSGQLYRIRRSADIVVPAAKNVSMVVWVRRTADPDPDRAFLVLLKGTAKPEDQGQSGPAFNGRITKGYIVPAGQISPPAELTQGRWEVMAKVCVGADGKTELVRPIIRMHPRDVGALVDWIIRQRHEPYRLDGLPVPYCYPLRFEAIYR
jgi:hypothetical protein